MAVLPIVAIGMGCSVTLAVYGYQFGKSNHTVYLLDALRRVDPGLLANDWYTTHTLQYHVIFTNLSAWLMRLRIIEAGFMGLYLALILLLHIAWRGIVRQLGGDNVAYLLSVVLYALCAAGTGLGMYQFFQDSSLLPSNIANVAMLWAIWMWLGRRYLLAGASFGVAGVFHLNHALIGIPLWLMLLGIEWKKERTRSLVIALLIGLIPSAINIGLAASMKLSRSGAMPLEQFVQLYVRLRHPHHYDPSSWPIGIWLATLIPAAMGYALLHGRVRRIFLFMLGLNVLALIGAGIWYVSETLIQMSLYRFSIYVQLLGCIAGGIWLCRLENRWWRPMQTAIVGCAAIILACVLFGPFFGVFRASEDDQAYLKLCRWSQQNLPRDAVLLVPPDEESMRLVGRRAIVVNFKCVPQLSAELAEWRDRLCDVLAMDSLTNFPSDYDQTKLAMRRQYDSLDFSSLQSTARKYQARFVVTTHPLDMAEMKAMYSDPDQKYFLFDLERLTKRGQ